MDLWCYEITHAGEGERGGKVLVMSPHAHRGPEFYAQEAAEYFQDQEKRQEGMDDSAFHGTSMVIEVEGYPGKPDLRFRVYCTVARSYHATPCPDQAPPRRPCMTAKTGAVAINQATSASIDSTGPAQIAEP